MFHFEILAEDRHSKARLGRFHTPHGTFETPCFMPCGTKGTVKTLTPDELTSIGCQIILSNTYHLALRPGEKLIANMGGLHHWMGWNGPILTDSGGFQVFSLGEAKGRARASAPASRVPGGSRAASLSSEATGRARASGSRGPHAASLSIKEEGVEFRSPLNGDTIFFSPKRAIAIQEKLGADIIMAFDECAPGTADKAYAREAMRRTHRWALECIKAKKRKDQALFPIIQGGVYKDLRRESAKFMTELDLPGIAVGGLAVGEKRSIRNDLLEFLSPLLPKNKPRYLMGVGEPEDLQTAVALGFDMFDCVLPTRLARHGSFWDSRGKRHSILNARFRADQKPLSQNCPCLACQKFSRSYLRHLMVENEMLGHRLLTIHNLTFLIEFLRKIRSRLARRSDQRERSLA